MNSPVPAQTIAPRPALVFVAACLWVAVSLTAGRLAAIHAPAAEADLVQQAVIALLLFGGFCLMGRAALPDLRALSAAGFVRRPGSAEEFGTGCALGWGVAIALLLPALLTGNLHASLTADTESLVRTARSAVVLLLFALNVQMIVSGLPARLLLRIAGPASVAVSAVFVVVLLLFLGEPGHNLVFAALAALLFVTAFLRTRALWLPLGLQTGWTLTQQLLFGAPSPYTPPSSGVMQSQAGGPLALTGGSFGPEASGFAVLVLLAALVALFRLTRNYAWHYTYQPVEPAGYPMEVAPPAEHLREERRAAASVPLVQIDGVTHSDTSNLPPDSGR